MTQLYVSVDAATRDSLKAIDRPLFKDFWERFLACLSQLRDKRQRTVYRLTLVKSWNMEEVENYVSLIEVGGPDLIEIKAVTYCGTSDASTLTMEHVPWHHEVVAFAKAIAAHPAARDRYGVACEHKHSVSSSPSVIIHTSVIKMAISSTSTSIFRSSSFTCIPVSISKMGTAC